jgi:diketogulonate reductase-like aldo/keto reductase
VLQAIEGLVREGLVRSIGVSNFGARKLAEILSYAQISPAVCQVRGPCQGTICSCASIVAAWSRVLSLVLHAYWSAAGGGASLPP